MRPTEGQILHTFVEVHSYNIFLKILQYYTNLILQQLGVKTDVGIISIFGLEHKLYLIPI